MDGGATSQLARPKARETWAPPARHLTLEAGYPLRTWKDQADRPRLQLIDITKLLNLTRHSKDHLRTSNTRVPAGIEATSCAWMSPGDSSHSTDRGKLKADRIGRAKRGSPKPLRKKKNIVHALLQHDAYQPPLSPTCEGKWRSGCIRRRISLSATPKLLRGSLVAAVETSDKTRTWKFPTEI